MAVVAYFNGSVSVLLIDYQTEILMVYVSPNYPSK